MWVLLAWLYCVWQTSAAVIQQTPPFVEATHDLGWDNSGKLVFTQLESESKRTHATTEARLQGLYSVKVNLDIEAMQSASGVTMMFDKVNHVMRLDAGISPVDGLAWGRYVDTIPANGWSELYLDTTKKTEVSNDVRMYAAGYIEGLITCVRLSEHYANVHRLLLRTEATKHALSNLKKVLSNELGFWKQKANLIPHIMSEEPADPYWKHSRYMLFQLWGLTDGYNFAAHHFGTNSLKMEDLMVLNLGGELGQILEAYTPKAVEDRATTQAFTAMTFLQKGRGKGHTAINNMKVRRSRFAQRESHRVGSTSAQAHALRSAFGLNASEDPLDDQHWERRVAETGHCSALVKLTQGSKDVYVGHTTWDDYSKMTRVFKYYNFQLDGSATMASKIGFSSYPGVISSTDDFYAMSSGLVVMDTSIEILNPFLWDKVEEIHSKPHIPNFVHLMITNRLAKNGAHWTRLFSTQNTGTYTSQWMVVDYNRFRAGQPVPDNFFWVLETVPGLTHAEDMSHHLRDNGYWPSFNRPYFDDVRDVTGHTAAQQSHGSIYSWLNNPRAQIFKGAQASVGSLLEMRELMSRNLSPSSGVAPAEPGHEISARMDLSPHMPIPNGGIDTKVLNRCLFNKLEVQAKSGPAHGAVPAFKWLRPDGGEIWNGYPHIGLPNIWNFDWVQMTPLSQGGVSDVYAC